MSSTYSPLLRFELIGSGEQAGLWGTTTNQNLGSLVEQAIAGVATITLSSTAQYVLQELNGTPDQARCAVLSFIGAPGGATEIIIPAKQKLYVVRNSCGASLTIKCVGDLGTGVQVDDGNATLVFCNGERALAGLQTTATANMTGPGSSTANAFVRWSGTSGTNTLNSVATLDDNGAPTFVGTVTVGAQSSTVGGQVSLKESSGQGSNTVSLRAPASLGSDITLTLPDNTGSNTQVLTTNGSGVLSWSTPTGGVTSVNGQTGAVTLTYSSVGAPSTSGSGATGTWGINISGNAATVSGLSSGTNYFVGGLYSYGNVVAYYSSDIKFKENVRPIPDALATVNAIGGKLFDWTDAYIETNGGADGYFLQKADFGVIAQDVEKVFPTAVRKREDGSLAVDYEKLSALAFAAIGELTARIEALEAK